MSKLASVQSSPCSGDLIESLTNLVERGQAAVNRIVEAPLAKTPLVIHEADPVLVPDAGQHFSLVSLDHLEECNYTHYGSVDGEEKPLLRCGEDTRLAVRRNDGESYELQPFCKDHVHILFAEFLVGA